MLAEDKKKTDKSHVPYRNYNTEKNNVKAHVIDERLSLCKNFSCI